MKKQWCIPPEASEDFVSAMEDVLEVYQRPEDPNHPVVCVDEKSQQHMRNTDPFADGTGNAGAIRLSLHPKWRQ